MQGKNSLLKQHMFQKLNSLNCVIYVLKENLFNRLVQVQVTKCCWRPTSVDWLTGQLDKNNPSAFTVSLQKALKWY